ncbi:hypothetical protein MMPV_002539 [Pyropia vietnamensis]
MSTVPVTPAASTTEPFMSWLTSPLLLGATTKARRTGRPHHHRRQAVKGSLPHQLPAVGSGIAAPPAPANAPPRGPSAGPVKASSGAAPRGGGGPRLSATVTVPAVHAAWLTAAARRYNDGTGAVALNKTARNAVEYAQATLSVEEVIAAAAAASRETDGGQSSRNHENSGSGGGGGRSRGGGDSGQGGLDGWSDTDASTESGPEVTAAAPAVRFTVRLAAAPLRFLEEVADAAGASGCRCSVALGLVLAAVRQGGASDVFTRRWGDGCNTASIYADVGVYARRGGGVLW